MYDHLPQIFWRWNDDILQFYCLVSYFNYGMNLHSWQKESRHVENTWLEEPLENNVKADSRNSHPSFKANGGGVFLSKC